MLRRDGTALRALTLGVCLALAACGGSGTTSGGSGTQTTNGTPTTGASAVSCALFTPSDVGAALGETISQVKPLIDKTNPSTKIHDITCGLLNGQGQIAGTIAMDIFPSVSLAQAFFASGKHTDQSQSQITVTNLVGVGDEAYVAQNTDDYEIDFRKGAIAGTTLAPAPVSLAANTALAKLVVGKLP